jgi:hypothetical protein
MRPGKWAVTAVGMVAAALGAIRGWAADYRGMPAGWPHSPAPTAGLAPAAGSLPPGNAVLAARPASLASGQAAYLVPVAYGAPVRYVAGQANYGYGYAAPMASYRPTPIVAYMPVAIGSAPGNAYVASTYGTTARYASYAVTPAGLSSAGSEAAAYYGQPTPLNYMPPQFVYRTTYAAVPVYLYRPVTVYDPVTAQPTTCLQPSMTTQCQPQRHRWFSWLHPATWFGGGCPAGGCQPPAATTTYCASGTCQPAASTCGAASCGQPYYPTAPATPAIPAVPAPSTTVPPPATTIPAIPRGTIIPPAGTTIPPPPTRVPAGSSGLAPADLPPRLAPGTTVTPAPGGTFTPPPSGGTTVPSTVPPATSPSPSPFPGGSFPTTPSTPPSGFGSGAFSPPAAAPRSAPPQAGQAMNPAVGTVSGRAVGSSNLREWGDESPANRGGPRDPGVIRAPELGPALPQGVRTLPDLDAPQTPQPSRRSPPLIDPRDKTALLQGDPRWAVVPARWPTRPPTASGDALASLTESRPMHRRSLNQPRQGEPEVATAVAHPPATSINLPVAPAAADAYDDRGWRPATGF